MKNLIIILALFASTFVSTSAFSLENGTLVSEIDRLVLMPTKARPLIVKAKRFGINTETLRELVSYQPGVVANVSTEARLCIPKGKLNDSGCWASVGNRMAPMYELEGEIEAIADAIDEAVADKKRKKLLALK